MWELNGIKSTEEQYIIAIYQINTNSISVQDVEPFLLIKWMVVEGPVTTINDNAPHLYRYEKEGGKCPDYNI